ncbi:MAG: AAA family ATPase [Spirochaetia bacterium]
MNESEISSVNTDKKLVEARKTAGLLLRELKRVILGKDEFLLELLTAFLSGGHVLLEDVPGLGKTTVAHTLAMCISGNTETEMLFRRIQFTPDLLPYDITGVDIFDPDTRDFVFRPGPVFTNILLADELNRTTPKVQSALLEVMAEGQVTVGRRTYKMEPPFFVIATQNPIEIEGTYTLPIAQLDRFLMRLEIGYPDFDHEVAIVNQDPSHTVMPEINPVCTAEEVTHAINASKEVFCSQSLVKAAVGISSETRKHRAIEYGVSPRGSLMLVKAAKTYAMLKDRDFVSEQDIIDIAPLVLSHRLKVKDLRTDRKKLIREVSLAQIEKYGE